MTGLDELVMHVADGCNLACTYCFADGGRYGDDLQRWMSPQVAAAAIESVVAQYGHIERIKFFGGEPLLNLPAITATISSLRALISAGRLKTMPKLGMVSNLTRLNGEIVDLIVDNDIRTTVSLDGQKSIHDRFRVFASGAGSYDKVVQNFVELAAEGATLAVEVVFGPAHVDAGETMVSVYDFLWETLHPDGLVIGLVGQTRQTQHTAEWIAFADRVGRDAYALGAHFVATLSREPSVRQIRRLIERCTHLGAGDTFCGAGTDSVTVDSQGVRWPCYFFKTPVAAAQPSTAVRVLPLITPALHTPKSEIAACQGCDFISVCHQCPGILNQATGSASTPIAIECEFFARMTEGMLGALSRLYQDGGETWHAAAASIRKG